MLCKGELKEGGCHQNIYKTMLNAKREAVQKKLSQPQKRKEMKAWEETPLTL